MPRKGKCFSSCRSRSKSDCDSTECYYTKGDKYKYCRLAFTRKMGADCKPGPRGPFLRKRNSATKQSIRKEEPLPLKVNASKPKKLSELKPSKTQIREVIKNSEPAASEIVLPEPIHVPPHKKVKSEMDFFSGQSVKFEKYGGKKLIGNLYYLYLLNKYKSKCLAYEQGQFGLAVRVGTPGTSLETAGHYAHMQNVAKHISKCAHSGLETIIIPLSIRIGGKSSGHANVLIYRKIDNTIERFEPHGSQFEFRKLNGEVEDKLVEFCAMVNTEFDKRRLPHIRFKSASEVCPRINGLQILESTKRIKGPNEGGGYCLAWSMFFVELALNNPGVPSNELLEMIMQYINRGKVGQNYLVNIIKGYSYHVSTKLEKYFSILFDETDVYNKIVERKLKRRNVENQVDHLIRIEMRSNDDPNFNAEVEMQKIRDQLIVAENNKEPTIQWLIPIRIKNLREELVVYERFVALKNPSPIREVVYASPKKRTQRKKR